MSHDENLLSIVKTALGTFDHRQSYTPGMFEPLKPLFTSLGYESVAVYVADDYPDRMHLETGYGGKDWFPNIVLLEDAPTLLDALTLQLGDLPGLMAERLFSHGRELGALVATVPNPDDPAVREAFAILVQSVSIMAYIERVRTNCQRERQEHDVFFAQSLTSRLVTRSLPKIKGLRIGVEFFRSLEAAGDFYDILATDDNRLLGFVGSCSGLGLRTALDICCIMQETHRAFCAVRSPAETLHRVNTMLVEEKKRAHQASLCVFEIDTDKNRLRLAKAGKLGLLIGHPDGEINNISAFGSMFLGMNSKPKIHDEEFEFTPGHALFCVTEGFYSCRSRLGNEVQAHWFLEAFGNILRKKRKKNLVTTIFEDLNITPESVHAQPGAVTALSVEAVAKK